MKLAELFRKMGNLDVNNSNIACLMNVLKDLSHRKSIIDNDLIMSSYTFYHPETLFAGNHDEIIQWLEEQGFEIEEYTEVVNGRKFNHVKIKYHLNKEDSINDII